MDKSTPFFSVVIPTLNEEHVVPKLLRCLTHQLDKDFEVIIVDGTSRDKTISIAKTFEEFLPLTIVVSDRHNISADRNLGARHAFGQYLVFLDADVTIPTNFLSEIHHHLTETKPPCRFLTAWMKPDSRRNSDRLIATFANISMDIAKDTPQPLVAGWTIVLKKTVFDKVNGFDEKVKLAEDHDLARRLYQTGVHLQVLKNPKVTVSFRRFRREGTFNLVKKYAFATAKIFFEGPITEKIFDYPMGGKVPRVPRLNIQTRLKKYLRFLRTFPTSGTN